LKQPYSHTAPASFDSLARAELELRVGIHPNVSRLNSNPPLYHSCSTWSEPPIQAYLI
jgi:hypothetical protein